MEDLREVIKQCRGPLKQAEFAKKLGVARQLVYQWENGLSKPSKEIMDRIGIKVEYVLEDICSH